MPSGGDSTAPEGGGGTTASGGGTTATGGGTTATGGDGTKAAGGDGTKATGGLSDAITRAASGEPFAAGREADVFLLDDVRVLRRYRYTTDTTGEAEVMAYAAGHGYPVPAVHAARGSDMVLDRLHGPTLGQAALAGQISLHEGAAMLADLLRRLHELPPLGGKSTGGVDTIVHLDLHPDNVLLTERGPMVIDWRNARDGPGDLDTALTALILAQVAIGSIEHPLGPAAGEALDRFLEIAPGDPTRLLDDAVSMRSRQSTMSPDEISALDTAAARVRKR